MITIATDVGIRLQQLRKSRNISQEKFAFICGLDRTYISSIENGKRNVTILSLLKICNSLDISIYDFFNSDQFKRNG